MGKETRVSGCGGVYVRDGPYKGSREGQNIKRGTPEQLRAGLAEFHVGFAHSPHHSNEERGAGWINETAEKETVSRAERTR